MRRVAFECAGDLGCAGDIIEYIGGYGGGLVLMMVIHHECGNAVLLNTHDKVGVLVNVDGYVGAFDGKCMGVGGGAVSLIPRFNQSLVHLINGDIGVF